MKGQRTYMHNPQQCGDGQREGGLRPGGGGQRSKNGDNSNSVNNKNKVKKQIKKENVKDL